MKKHAALLFLIVAALSGCRKQGPAPAADSLMKAYDVEADWNDSQHLIPLDYQQAQGKRLFYVYCVWCHADSTPAGPSNRSNVTPAPALMNDGTTMNRESDEYLQNIITLGGSALGKSGMMPPYGRTLSQDQIRALVDYTRAIAQPPYQPAARPTSQYTGR